MRDVESHTIHYVLTRPVPRSAWVLGKFAAFWAFTFAIMAPSVLLSFGACMPLANLTVTAANMKLLIHYLAVLGAALALYGSLSMFLGSFAKYSVLYSILYLFLWQRLAVVMPGTIDFFTMEKYLKAMLPPLAVQRNNPVVREAINQFQKEEFLIGATKATLVVFVTTLLFVGLTSVVVRIREFTAARAVGG